MKQENIDKDIRQAIISTIISLIVRTIAIYLWITYFKLQVSSDLLRGIIWLFMGAIAIQGVFLPYLTTVRIKEIKKGEIYEASKY